MRDIGYPHCLQVCVLIVVAFSDTIYRNINYFWETKVMLYNILIQAIALYNAEI